LVRDRANGDCRGWLGVDCALIFVACPKYLGRDLESRPRLICDWDGVVREHLSKKGVMLDADLLPDPGCPQHGR
jgi:hypothetical protein